MPPNPCKMHLVGAHDGQVAHPDLLDVTLFEDAPGLGGLGGGHGLGHVGSCSDAGIPGVQPRHKAWIMGPSPYFATSALISVGIRACTELAHALHRADL